MAYQAIYRKWRPLVFEDVVGQPHITETLKTEIITNKVAHAYLFCGTRGTGKTTTAKILSRAVNCETPNKDGNPCNQCASCKGILNGSIMDVVEIDAASNNGVDSIRELRDEVLYTPANAKYKVYIIDEVHMLSTAAFNALLKTLEEPPAHVIFILATTEPHKILPTIQSRCQRFDFRRISAHHIAGRIGEITRKDGIAITKDAIDLVASLGDGSMRDALSILDLCSGINREVTKEDIENLAGVSDTSVLRTIATALINGDTSTALVELDRVISMGRDTNHLLDELLATFRELLICKMVTSSDDIINKSLEETEEYRKISNSTSAEYLLYAIKTLSDTVSVCKWSTSPRIMLESAVVKLANPCLDATSEAFAARLRALESKIAVGTLNCAPIVNHVAEVHPIEKNTEPEKEDTPNPIEDTMEEITDELDDEPPFDIDPPQEPIVEPNIEECSVEEETFANENVVEELAKQPEVLDNWQEILENISIQNPMLFGLLSDTEAIIKDNQIEVLFDNTQIRDLVRTNEGYMSFLEKALPNRLIKLLIKGEESDAGANVNKKDPFDDILSKKDIFGEQMTIL